MNIPAQPQRYEPTVDLPSEDEGELALAISDKMLDIAAKTFADGGHAIRSVHAKSHGLLEAEFEVLAGLPAALAQGLFAQPGRHPAVMRLSTIPGDLLGDAVSTPRGLAIKVLGVEGERLEGDAETATQDFVTVNGPRFNARDGKAFLRSLKLVALTTDRAEGSKKLLSAGMRGLEKLIEAFGGQSASVAALGGQPAVHILGETFWSQLPIRYGDFIAKLQIVPVSPSLTALTGTPIDLGADDNALRQAVIDYFTTQSGTWELRVQLCTTLEQMPIDDPTREWDEQASPFVTVARLTAPPQLAWSQARSTAVDDGMGFSPWHGLQAHRPLGEIMRLRQLAYARSQAFRSQRNATPVREPANLDALTDD
jgi:hypothetical protein